MLDIILVAVLSLAVEERSPESLYQEAWYREIAEARAGDALEIYESLAGRADLPAPLRAKALFRSGVCLRKLQKRDEAKAVFERVLKDYAAVTDVAAAARREIAGETEDEASLRKKAESLIARLGDRDAKARMEARMSLASLGPRVAPHVLATLAGSDFVAGREAAVVLVRLAEEDASLAGSLLGALRSGDDAVRKHVVEAIAEQGGVVGGVGSLVGSLVLEPRIIEWLEDPAPHVRVAVASILHGRSGPAGLEALRKLLRDPVKEVRLEAVEGLGGHSRGRRPAPDPRPVAPIEWLTEAYSDSDAEVREAAVRLVFQRLEGPGRAEAPFDPSSTIGLLEDPSPGVVAHAMRALAARQKVLSQAKKGSMFPAGEAGARAISRIARLAANPDFQARDAAVALLGASRRPEAVETLLELARGRDKNLAQSAIAALGELGDRTVLPSLLDLCKDPVVGNAAWQVLSGEDWIAPEIDRFVARLPDLGAPDRVAAVLDKAAELKRNDAIIAAARHYDALDQEGRWSILHRLSSLGVRREWLPVVLKGLDEPNKGVREVAIQMAVGLADPQVVPGLARCLDDPSDNVRYRAAHALGTVGDRRAVEALIARLADDSPNIEQAAGLALQRLADRRDVGPILEVLEKGGVKEPRHALDCIAALATAEEAGRIARAVDALPAHARPQALMILGELKAPGTIPAIRAQLAAADPDVRGAAVTALGAIGGEDVLQDLVKTLADPESTVRKAAAEALGRQEPARVRALDGALAALGRVSEDPDWSTRLAAVDALADVGDASAVPVLVEAMKTGDSRPRPGPRTNVSVKSSRPPRPRPGPNPTIAHTAWKALEKLGDRTVVEPMLEILAEPRQTNEWLDLENALSLVRRFATPEDAPAIARALEKVKPAHRPGLIEILGGMKTAEASQAVRPYLADPAEEVRAAAARAMAPAGDAGVLGALAETLRKEESGRVRAAIIDALSNSGKPESIPAVLESFRKHPSNEWQEPGFMNASSPLPSLRRFPPEDALKALSSVLQMDVASSHKQQALDVIAAIEHPGVREIIERETASADAVVGQKAIGLLGSYLDPRSIPRLLELLKHPDGATREAARKSIDEIRYYLETQRLAQAGAAAPPEGGATGELIRQLGDPTPAVRAAAARSLGRLRSREALAALVRARKDADPAVRAAVEEALDAIAE